jgi:hypothetical protein
MRRSCAWYWRRMSSGCSDSSRSSSAGVSAACPGRHAQRRHQRRERDPGAEGVADLAQQQRVLGPVGPAAALGVAVHRLDQAVHELVRGEPGEQVELGQLLRETQLPDRTPGGRGQLRQLAAERVAGEVDEGHRAAGGEQRSAVDGEDRLPAVGGAADDVDAPAARRRGGRGPFRHRFDHLMLLLLVLGPAPVPGRHRRVVIGDVLRFGGGDQPAHPGRPERREDRGDKPPTESHHGENQKRGAYSPFAFRGLKSADAADQNGQPDAVPDRCPHLLLAAHPGVFQLFEQLRAHVGEDRRRLGEPAAVELTVGERPAEPFTDGGEEYERDRVRRDIHRRFPSQGPMLAANQTTRRSRGERQVIRPGA